MYKEKRTTEDLAKIVFGSLLVNEKINIKTNDVGFEYLSFNNKEVYFKYLDSDNHNDIVIDVLIADEKPQFVNCDTSGTLTFLECSDGFYLHKVFRRELGILNGVLFKGVGASVFPIFNKKLLSDTCNRFDVEEILRKNYDTNYSKITINRNKKMYLYFDEEINPTFITASYFIDVINELGLIEKSKDVDVILDKHIGFSFRYDDKQTIDIINTCFRKAFDIVLKENNKSFLSKILNVWK